MIVSKEGKVTIDGTEPMILAETMGILDAVYQVLAENHGEDFARSRIESLGRLYLMREEGNLGKRSEVKMS